MPDVLVTGGAGFIGHHVVRELVECGLSVRVLDDLSRGRRERLDGLPCELVVGDVVDRKVAKGACEEVQALVHLAAKTSVEESLHDPDSYMRTNVLGTQSILAEASIVGIKRILFASSSAVYGNKEDGSLNPLSPYAATKVLGEGLVRSFPAPSAVLRFFNVYGPGQEDSPYSGVITRFMAALKDGRPMEVFGDGHQTRDFIHVSDIARLIALLVLDQEVTGTFDVGTGTGLSILALAGACIAATGLEGRVIHRPAREGEVRHSVARRSARLEAAGWDPMMPLELGLAPL